MPVNPVQKKDQTGDMLQLGKTIYDVSKSDTKTAPPSQPDLSAGQATAGSSAAMERRIKNSGG